MFIEANINTERKRLDRNYMRIYVQRKDRGTYKGAQTCKIAHLKTEII